MSEVRHTAAEHSIITTYRKPIWRNFISAIKTYQLISAGDRIAVCMSGGKDSLLLAACLRALQRHSEVPFELCYLTMDPGYTPENRAKVEENARRLGFPIEIFESDIFSIVNDVPASPCHVCAAMRRGYLYKEAQKRGCNNAYPCAAQSPFAPVFPESRRGWPECPAPCALRPPAYPRPLPAPLLTGAYLRCRLSAGT